MIDLEEIKRYNRRLEALICEDVDDETLRRILDKRADNMSARRGGVEEREVLSDVIVARRGDILLGFPVQTVREVRKNYAIPLAHGNEIVVGLFQARGQINSLVDIVSLLGVSTTGGKTRKKSYIVHVSWQARDLGVVVDELVGRRELYRDEVAAGHEEERGAIVSSITRDLVSLIDIKALFSAPGIILDR